MASITDILQELISPATRADVARQTGESESAVTRGFAAVIPTIAAAIANRADDHSFMRDLAGLATRSAVEPPAPGGLGGLISSVSSIDTSTPSGGFLSSLFGHNLSGLIDSIARYAGMRGSSAASIISVAAPLVLGYIGRMIRSDNLTVSDLADRFRTQRAQIASAVPAGFELPDFLRAPAAARTAAAAAAPSLREARTWVAPAVALLAALGFAGLLWRTFQTPAPQQARVVTEAGEKAVGTTGSMIHVFTRKLPGNVAILIPAGGAEDRLSAFLARGGGGAPEVTLDRIEFDTGSATLTSDSGQQLDNVATILRAYPAAIVTVCGYTDNAGDEASNRTLSKARAEAVADRIKAEGVPAERVRTEGYGSSKPVADNATPEGRAKNRRVTLDVAQR